MKKYLQQLLYLPAITVTFLLGAGSATFAQTAPCGETDYDCQIKAAAKQIQANPQDAAAYFARANAYFSKGDYETAIKDYTKTLELNPKELGSYDNRGLAYYYLKNYTAAIADYTKSIEADPNYVESYINRGNAYDDSGNSGAAIKDYNQAVKLDPKNVGALYNRGITAIHHGDNKQAISDFQKVLQLQPDNADARELLAKAQSAKQEKDVARKEKWTAFGKPLGDIAEPSQQSSEQSNNQRSGDESIGSQNTTSNRSSGGSPSEADVQAWVRAYEDEINPTGGVGSPISISLSFGEIRYGAVRNANEGDRLRHVKSDQLYMVTVDYAVNQKFSDGTYPKHKKWNFEFYVNTADAWSAFSYGPAE